MSLINISRENAFQIYQDYLDYRYPTIEVEGIRLTPSQLIVRTQTPRSQDGLLDRWLYVEECSGRIMVSQDGTTVGITLAGAKVYTMTSPYFRKEYGNV